MCVCVKRYSFYMCVCHEGDADELEVAFNELHEMYLDTCIYVFMSSDIRSICMCAMRDTQKDLKWCSRSFMKGIKHLCVCVCQATLVLCVCVQ